MFVGRLIVAPHTGIQRIVNCEAIRTIRGRIRIPTRLTERKFKPKKHNSSDYLADVEKSNIGIGRILRSNLESFGKNIDDDIDENELFLSETALDDIKPTIDDLAGDIREKESQKQFQAVKKKYFRPEKVPIMLTYIEQQQILHLHQEDPDYYDADKLAEGFPASPNIIKKVLKSKFVAYTVNQVLRHDEIVRKNWEAFEKGELKFNDELQKIYSSFSGRSHLVPKVEEIQKYIPPPPDFASQIPVKEMSEIIASSHKYKLEEEKRRKNVEVDEQGRLVYHSLSRRADIIDEDESSKEYLKHHTLDSFRKNIRARSNPSEVDQVITSCEPIEQLEKQSKDKFSEKKQDQSKDKFLKKIPPQRNDVSATGIISKDFDPLMIDKISYNYPLRIHIPNKLWKKDKLYKVRDCFYNDNGYFIYRVPGLEL